MVGDQINCQKCDPILREHCHLRHKLWLRYPYVVAMNGAFVVAYCTLALWYLVNHYFGTMINQTLMSNQEYAAATVGAITLPIVVMGFFVFHFLLNSPRSKVEATEKKNQKIENTHKTIRIQQNELDTQKERIAALEAKLGKL